MNNINFTFDRTKAVEVILYLAHKAVEPDFHSIGKILYLADKLSLEKYGRFISGDSYRALPWGPVPVDTYDLMKHGGSDTRSSFKTEEYFVVPLRQPDLDQLSESDVECLDAGMAEIGDAKFSERHNITADEAYEKAWAKRGASRSVPMPVEDIARQLEHADELIDYLTHRG